MLLKKRGFAVIFFFLVSLGSSEFATFSPQCTGCGARHSGTWVWFGSCPDDVWKKGADSGISASSSHRMANELFFLVQGAVGGEDASPPVVRCWATRKGPVGVQHPP